MEDEHMSVIPDVTFQFPKLSSWEVGVGKELEAQRDLSRSEA
jgi:hypothetical protein